MKKFIQVVQVVAGICLVAFPSYLLNEGTLGLNLNTILATASPITVMMITGMYQIFNQVLPIKTVLGIVTTVKDAIGEEKFDELAAIVNVLSPQQIVDGIESLVTLVKDIPTVLTLLKVQTARQLELGVFDDSNLKEEAEKLI